MSSHTGLFGTAKQIYRSAGFLPMLRRGFAFVVELMFFCRTYYVYVDPIEKLQAPNEADLIPKIGNHTSKAVSSNEEADDLEAQGFEFRSQVANAIEHLDEGAVALCIFVGQELACIEWIAMTKQAYDSLGQPPFSINFSKQEAWSGGLWTNPKYRRKGLRGYSSFKTLEFLRQNGIETTRTAIAKNNIAAQRSRPLFLPGPCAEGRYLRILWWKSWREKPLTPDSSKEQSNAGD